jgi:hypothetical protein
MCNGGPVCVCVCMYGFMYELMCCKACAGSLHSRLSAVVRLSWVYFMPPGWRCGAGGRRTDIL